MTTALDHITSTAPERIYLDLGDCAHLIKPEETFATYAQGEITWSEGNDSGVGIPYVRADLVPTPAASGAAPAEDFEAWLDEFDDPQFPELRRRDRFGERVIEDFRVGWDAALASREASRDALKDDGSTPGPWRVEKRERDGELAACWIAAPDCNGFAYAAEILGDDEYRDGADAKANGMSRLVADCELIVKAVAAYRAALASPQVAPAPAPKSFARWRLSKKYHSMQKDPTGEYYSKDEVDACFAAPVAPQDDARDAAKWRALPAYAERHQVNLVHLFRDIDDAMSLSTPAAKPTEPTLPTQGEQSHD